WIGNQNSILGLLADMDVDFQIQHLSPDTDPDVRMLVTLTGGEISNTALPFPLVDLNGQIEYAANRITLREITAKNGPTVVNISGTLSTEAAVTSGKVDLAIENLNCDERLRSRLSNGFSRIYDMHHPKGYLDMSLSLVGTPEGVWKPQDLVVAAKKCSVMHDIFPYPVRDAVGSIQQEGRDLKINMLGYAGNRPITLTGLVRNPGPEAHIVFEIDVQKLPLDQQFFNACNPQLQQVLTTMGLTGLVDAHWKLERPPGPGQRMKPQLKGSLHAATMVYRTFPYRIEELSGELEFDGVDWTFRDLKGVHGAAQLAAEGTYTKLNGTNNLELKVTTENAPIDQSLYHALPENLKELWQQFSPSGTIEKSVTHVNWLEGQPAVISLPEIRVSDGSILCQQFPYELEGIRAEYSYSPATRESPSGWLTIKSFSGRHDAARLAGNGYVEIGAAGDWRFHLSDWTAEDLVPDQSLLRACDAGLREIFAVFDSNQALNINGELELRGTSNLRDPITAGWYAELDLSGGKVTLGLELSDVHGRVTTSGKWDGFEVDADGILDLSTLTVHDTRRFRLHEIRGPFAMRNGILVAGTDRVIERPTRATADKNEQVTARVLGGELAFNVAVDFQEIPEYRLSIDLEGGRLEQFAQLYMRSRERLRGTINGWVTLEGQGESTQAMTGRGQMQISPAELYELPVIFQVLSQLHTLNPKSPDAAAFNYALARFGIRNERFEFQAIDLVGSQIQLQGRGIATFGGRLGLTFASILQRSMVRRPQVWIPIVTEAAGFFSGVTDLVGVAVEVTGTTDNPQTRIIPGRNIDQALRSFFDSIRPLPLTPPLY
ncbi:MAG: AsmA-like C-terminal region-containing protein, partial [Planctomycetaceae bacterium]